MRFLDYETPGDPEELEKSSPDFQKTQLRCLTGSLGRKIFGEENYEYLQTVYEQKQIFQIQPKLTEIQEIDFEQFSKFYELSEECEILGGVERFIKEVEDIWKIHVSDEDIKSSREDAYLVLKELSEGEQ
jgi:hypothetical protein